MQAQWQDNALSVQNSACQEMALANGTNAVYVDYFLKQQRAEVEFLDDIERKVCLPSPLSSRVDEVTFQRRRQQMLAPIRMAVSM